MSQFFFFLVMVGVQMNLLGFPAMARARICAVMIMTYLSNPSFSSIRQPVETMMRAVALLCGECIGFVSNRTLQTMFVSQAQEHELMTQAQEQRFISQAQDLIDDARVASSQPDHSRHPDQEGQQQEQRHQQQLAKQQQHIPPEELLVMSIIGKGGMGLVHKGSWMGEVVALKVWRHVGDVHTLVRESQALARLRHPCICRAYGTTQVEGRHAIVMEYMANGALSIWLRDVARDQATAPFPLICRMASQCASGLAYLHRQHYVHHDVKTGNVLLDELLNAKVADFGLSRFENRPVPTLDMLAKVAVTPDGAAEEAPSFLPSRVAAGALGGEHPAAGTLDGEHSFMWTTPIEDGQGPATQHIGTLRYLAPEVFFELRGTPESDVYAFGFMLWEMAHQTLAFAGIDAFKVASEMTLRGERPPISLTGPRAALTSMINACWHPNPQERPTMQQCAAGLSHVLELATGPSSNSSTSTWDWTVARDVDSENGNSGQGGSNREPRPPFASGARRKRFSWISRFWGPAQGSRKIRWRPNASK